MPSNAMKSSQLRALLEQYEQEHGDLDVVLALPGDGVIVAVDGRNVNVSVQFGLQTLAEPVLAFGQWRAQTGAITNSPGSKYETDAVPGDWRSDLSAAPADVVVDIWRRGSKADTGYRDAAGKWFAFEGGTRAWELAPGAVLQWKPKT